MRASLFGLAAFAALASANIDFTWTQPPCDHVTNPGNCLTGQKCSTNNT